MAVIAVMILMMALAGPALTSLKGSRDVTHVASDIESTLEQARAYAMANNTYVFVGVQEVDVTQPATSKTQTAGVGRVAIAIVASKDGTRIYDPNSADISGSWQTNYAKGASLIAIGNLREFEDVHIPDSLGTVPTTGKMARPIVDSPYHLGSAQCISVTPFSWPLGSNLAGGQYNFTKVIQFDPQGSAKVQSNGSGDNVIPWLEVDLQQTHGKAITPLPANPNTGTQTAILIDGITGAIHTYTP